MLSLILPTFNEAQNLPTLVDILDGVLRGRAHEIIIVDDNSPDGTWKVAGMLAEMHPTVRVIRRMGKKGLSSAVVEGFDAARGEILAVMDADGQHDPTLITRMLAEIEKDADIVVGSRYMPGGSVGAWVRDRRIISSLGTFFSRRLSVAKISDPLSGLFALKADLYKKISPQLKPTGFKILLEVLAHAPKGTRVTEIPLVFRMRLHGESKLSLQVQLEFMLQVITLSLKKLLHGLPRIAMAFFWGCAIAMALSLVPRAWNNRLLFTNSDMRAKAETALNTVAKREGWILSDITFLSVTTSELTIAHTDHVRESVERKRCVVTLATSQLTCEQL